MKTENSINSAKIPKFVAKNGSFLGLKYFKNCKQTADIQLFHVRSYEIVLNAELKNVKILEIVLIYL